MWHRKKDESANSGIQNSGSMSNVQNQAGATGSTQIQGASPADPQDLAKLTALLAQLRQALANEQAKVENYDKCVDLLDETADLKLDQPDGRTIATGMLTRIRQLCGGAPNVLALIASTLDLITALQRATG
jgi:hypothetical protein